MRLLFVLNHYISAFESFVFILRQMVFIFVLWMVFDCIYDNQGLIPAMEMLFPTVEHRFCVKHIYNNFKLNFKGLELKATLWRCAMEWGPVGSSGSCPCSSL